MAGYTRQSVADIINGAEITAPPINAEFNQLVSAFNATTGHAHDGSTGNAPKIDLTTSITGYLPAAHGGVGGKNKFDATTAPAASNDGSEGYAPGSLWENTTNGRVYICVGNSTDAAVWRELVTVLSNNKFEPVTHNTIDLGTSSTRFKDLYLQGGATIEGASTFAGTLGVSGLSTLDSVTVTNAATLNGAVTIGNSSADLVGFNGRVTTSIVPNADDGVDLGSSTNEWRNLYIDGTATIDTLTVDENASIAGTLSVTSTSTLTGDVTMSGAADVTGNATVGGTFDVTGLSTLATVDVNGGNIDGTAIGSSTASSGVFTNLTASGTINFAGATVSNLGTVTTAAIGGGTINNAVIGGSTPAAITGTTITGTSFVGPVTGDITGDLTGDVTGNVTGDVTGDLTGNVTASSGTSTFNNVTVNGNLNMDATSAATITNLTAPTNDLDAATKLYVDTAVADLVDSAPDSLNTLNELAAAINDDASAYNTLNTAIGEKLPKAGGTMSGAINMGGQKVTNAADPTAAQDLATKNYIDTTYIDYSSAADAANDAEKLAINAEDAQYTLSDGTTTGYSALHYAAKAEASYDSFDDRYLGSKATDPTVDNDGDALVTGALYFDSTNGVMKVYNGTEWANASSSIEGIKSNFYYTATSGQTAFSGADDNSNTLVVDKAGLVNVYMNGVRLHEDDYTVSAAGDSVTLAAGASTGDLIYLEVFGNFAGQSGADVAITGGSITGLDEFNVSTTSAVTASFSRDGTDGDVLQLFNGAIGTTKGLGLGVSGTHGTINSQYGGIYIQPTGVTSAFFANGGDVDFYDTSGNASMRWDASSKELGIGTTAPIAILDAQGSQSFLANFQRTDAGVAAIRISGQTGEQSIIQMGDADDGDIQRIQSNNSDNSFAFFTNNGERLRIESDGDILFGNSSNYTWMRPYEASTGNLIISADNGGTGTNGSAIKFRTRGADKMIIQHDGAVGIGIATPTAAGLEIRTEANNTYSDTIPYQTHTGDSLVIYNNPSDSSNDYVAINMLARGAQTAAMRHIVTTPSGGDTDYIWQFRDSADTVNTTKRMIYTSDGSQRYYPLASTETAFNENGVDHDFRVESNSDTHALFVRGDTNFVSVGAGTGGFAKLQVADVPSSEYRTFMVSDPNDISKGLVMAYDLTNDRGVMHALDAGTGWKNIALAAQGGSVSIGMPVTGTIDAPLHVEGGPVMTGGWIRSQMLEGNFPTLVFHSTYGTDSYGGIGYDSTNENLDFWVGATSHDISSGSQKVLRLRDTDGFIWNDSGLSHLDFRVESDGSSHMLFVDAAANAVGINTSAPAATMHIRGISNSTNGDAVIRLDEYNYSHAGADVVGGGIDWYGGDASSPGYDTRRAFIRTKSDDEYNRVGLSFGTGTTGSVAEERFRLTAQGGAYFYPRDAAGYPNSFVWNEDGGDADFRVESDSNANAIFVDASNSCIMFNSNDPAPYDNSSTNGAAFTSDCELQLASDNNCLALNRTNITSGGVAKFFKQATQVGSISVSGSSTSYNTSSDHRLKENVVDLTGATERVKQLAPKRFNFIVDEDDTVVDGFLAHEAQTVVPEAVTGTHNEVDDDGNPVYQGIDQAKLVPLLTAALQEAITKIEDLEARVAALEA